MVAVYNERENLRKQLNLQIEYLKNSATGPPVCIYENQIRIGSEVSKTFINSDGSPTDVLYTMVVAKTQSGKTGSMLEVIRRAVNEGGVSPYNIFIITGLSSRDWKESNKKVFPQILHSNILHNNDVKSKLALNLNGKKKVLIIIDELHMASSDNQTIAGVLKECKFHDPEYCYENDIRIVEYSATPDGVLKDRLKNEERSRRIFAEDGDEYTSCFDLLEQGRVFQFKDLSEGNDVLDLWKHITNKYNTPKYHIIRTATKNPKKDKTEENLKTLPEFEVLEHNMNTRQEIGDLNAIIRCPPSKHTIIIIKEMLRCAKVLEKQHIGVVYERFCKNVNDSAIIQGLLGRVTGYGVPKDISVFTNIDTINRYKKLWDSEFGDASIKWISNTNNKSTYAKDDWCKDDISIIRQQIDYKIFDESERHTALCEFTQLHFDWKPHINAGKQGKIKTLINHSSDDIALRKWGINNKCPRRIAQGIDKKWVVWWSKVIYPGV
jgi:sulfur carrier protein ThiS